MSWRPGIRIEIVFTLTVLLAGVAALVGIVFLKVEERNLLEQKVKAGKQAVVSLQKVFQDFPPGAANSPDYLSSSHLQNLIPFLAQSQLFSQFSVVDPEFRIVADSQKEQIGKILRDPEMEKALTTDRIFVHEKGGKSSFSLLKKGPLFVSAPLVREGKIIGAVRGEFPLEDLRETLSHSQSTILLYLLFDIFVIVVVGSFLLSRIIVNPLKKLVQMSEKIADGNLDPLGGPAGGDEVGKLFSSFNHMAVRLRDDRKKMEEYIRSLETVNRELRSAQSEILRSEKMASIGRLASGVAHEVGNPTGAILGYVDLLSQGGLAKDEEKEILERTGKEAERIRRIVRELLDFSRPSPAENAEVDVPEIIKNAFSLLSHQKKVWKQIEVHTSFQENLPQWHGDPHQLQQVMINLFLNAADALMEPMPDGKQDREKKLRVAVRALEPEELGKFMEAQPRRRKGDHPDIDYSGLRGRESSPMPLKEDFSTVVCIEVEDTGPGIPPEAIPKIFDPFFTTKPPGQGTGLGLAICHRIMESYGGQICVRSESGKGAFFTLLMPVFKERHGA